MLLPPPPYQAGVNNNKPIINNIIVHIDLLGTYCVLGVLKRSFFWAMGMHCQAKQTLVLPHRLLQQVEI